MKTFMSVLLTIIIVHLHAASTNDALIIDVKLTETRFQISLPANPSTGYQWTIKTYDRALFNLVSSKYIAPTKRLIGAGGEMRYTFQMLPGVDVPTMTTIVFNYARSWEHTESLKVITIHFHDDSPNGVAR